MNEKDHSTENTKLLYTIKSLWSEMAMYLFLDSFLRLDFSDLDFLTLLCLNVHLVLILYSIYVGAVN